jgi:glycosyltransferase involved in cell wall biosynthesis
MKIAVIGAKGLPAKQGGIEHYCQELYPRMVEQGHSVDLFARSSYNDSPWLHHYDVRGVRVISLPSLKLKGLDALFSSALGAIASSGMDYDIIHFHAMGPSLMSWLPRLASTAKVVVTCQGLDGRRAKWGRCSSYMLRQGEIAAARFANGLIVVSEELRSYFMKTYGRETVYIPNAPARLSESNPDFSYGTSLGMTQKRYILFLGRLVPEKCPDLLIKAFQALKPSGWQLVLVGGDSDTGRFASKIADMTEKSRDIVFAGELHGAYLAEIVRGAGLFVLPSELEGLPLAMLEAMQEGIPVLASDIPPHRQLIGEGRGMLFKTGDMDSCVRCLDWAIHHPQEMWAMARNAQSHVQAKYNWNHITTKTLRLYASVCTSPDTFAAPVQPTRLATSGLINHAKVKPLGTYLIEAGLLTQEHINNALAEQKATGMRLGAILVQQGWIKEQTIEYLIEKVILPERGVEKRIPVFHT